MNPMTEQPVRLKVAYMVGVEARRANLNRWSPFLSGSVLAEAWLAGWEDEDDRLCQQAHE